MPLPATPAPEELASANPVADPATKSAVMANTIFLFISISFDS